MISSFLMIGQSNMAGRGFPDEVEPVFDERIKMLRNGRWQTMFEPINFDRPNSGVGLAASFAATWLLHNDGEIGLIPCADGGSSLDEWMPGSQLFEHALTQASFARKISSIKGILWHQGENDSFGGRSASYKLKFTRMAEAFRSEFEIPDLPIIIGGLGDFLTTGRYGKYFTEVSEINRTLQQIPTSLPNTYFVTAENLESNPDQLHFNAASQRILGIRYFAAFHEQKNITAPLQDEQNILKKIHDRELSGSEKKFLVELRFSKGELSLKDYESEIASIDRLSS